MGHAGAKRRGSSWSAYDQPDVNLKHSLLHPNYLVGTFPELFNADTGGSPTVVIWAEFSPDANTGDVSRLMQFDLSCLTRLRSCKERDLMPTVWAQSAEDIRESPKSLTCTPELSKYVAQLADVVTVSYSRPPKNSRTRFSALPRTVAAAPGPRNRQRDKKAGAPATARSVGR